MSHVSSLAAAMLGMRTLAVQLVGDFSCGSRVGYSSVFVFEGKVVVTGEVTCEKCKREFDEKDPHRRRA